VTSRTVMAARLGPASIRSGGRTVLVQVPANATEQMQDRIDTVMKRFLRDSDQLLYAGSNPTASTPAVDRVVSFAGRYGLMADPIEVSGIEPDLVIVIIDPLEDNIHTLTSPARVLAQYQRADLVITELPDHID